MPATNLYRIKIGRVVVSTYTGNFFGAMKAAKEVSRTTGDWVTLINSRGMYRDVRFTERGA